MRPNAFLHVHAFFQSDFQITPKIGVFFLCPEIPRHDATFQTLKLHVYAFFTLSLKINPRRQFQLEKLALHTYNRLRKEILLWKRFLLT